MIHLKMEDDLADYENIKRRINWDKEMNTNFLYSNLN